MIKIKVCGITNLEDALLAAEAGADALGFVFYEKSPRHIFPESAAQIIRQLPPFVQTVGLFVNETLQNISKIKDICGFDIIQLHGDESPDYCTGIIRRYIKALRVKDLSCLDSMGYYHPSAYLLDTWSPDAYGGTGKTFNWEVAAHAAAAHRVILAGGLTPDNVSEAISVVRPYGVDISSGVEQTPGKKDPHKVKEFIRNAREAV